MKKENITFLDVLTLFIGCFLMSLSLNMFFNPHSVAPGGITGFAIIVNSMTGIPLWVINLTLNIPLFILAYKILSKKDCVKTILGIIFLTLTLKYTIGLSEIHVTDDVLLASISGSILMGVGLGFIFRINGTTGGTDLLGLILNRFFPSLSVPILMGSADCIVVILSGIVTKEIEIGLYSAISLYIIVKISDIIIEGFNNSKSFTIISDKYKEISSSILEELDRGATILKGEGVYTGNKKNVLLVIVSRRQVVTLKKLVKEIDPNCFIIITSINEALGNGFKSIE
ncbi:YitT family protein [Romboutsia maritimum]|uniref:YitT family protein n=1 Tax=Romboutsia maritimum TaxID=2020948 RepID=UPI0026AF4006|nr:YitT family protein [Romboutsia maritimum]